MEKTKPLSAEKQALLALRLRGASKKPADARHLFRRANDEPAPLSFAQFYIWASDQGAPGNPSHNLPVGFRIRGQLDVGLLEDSFNAIVRRHEALRTTFAVKDGEPIQIIHPECRIKIAVIELAHLPVDKGEIKLQKLASKESVESFDLSRLPLIRVSLYKLGDTDHVLIVNLHHIIADGLSVGLLLTELDVFYRAFKSGSPPSLPDLPVQYADFAAWQRREFLKNSYPDQAEYWRAQMNGLLRPLALPFDRARPTVRSFGGANVFFAIPTSLVEKLNSLDGESGRTFFSIVLALFQLMLHRYSGSEDMLILTPVSIRTQDELRPLIGNFLNLVPLRCDVSGNPTFIELLRRTRDTTLNALSNKDLPFDKIVDGMKIERDSGRDPLFQFLLQVLPAAGAKFADLEIENFQIDLAFSQFDLSLHLYERGEGYLGRFEYSTDVFNADTVEKLSQNFMQVLEAVVTDPKRPIATLPLMGMVDRKAAPERSSAEAAYVAPHTVLEKQIAKVWGEMLQLKQVGLRENFFDLGGHSLLIAKTCDRLCSELHCELKVVDLFTYPTVEALANHFGQKNGTDTLVEDALARVNRRSGGFGQVEPIAIVSMAGRFPGARDIESFWANLREGKESITFFSTEEMRESGVPAAILSDPNYVGALGYLEDADKFDAAFFGYSSREAEIIDPQERLLLQCASEALERAGYDPDRYHGLVGVYAGQLMNSYLSSMRAQHIPLGSAGWLSTALASAGDFLTTRISYKLNLHGPSVNVQTACSTSLVAVHQACRALWDHECDMALAGGVSVTLPLKSGSIYMQEGIYSPDGHCRVFDAGANGTVSGNGVALVLLKRLSDALADSDHIHAVIHGTAINNDGSSKVGYTAPSVEGQAQVIALAQASAQCDPDTIGYVEAHGTGTLLGDPIEVAALTRVFGDGRRRSSPCWIGSVKSNIGHLYAVAGVAGLIKAALSLEHRELVPSLNFGNPNPQIDFAAGPFKVNTELRHWESPEGAPRRAGVSSFGFGGTNAHAVLEEAPALESSGPSREWQLVCLSAKTDAALAQATTNLSRHLSEHPDINLADATYTLQLGRREFSHRCIVVCRDVADARAALSEGAAQRLIRSVQKGGKRSVQFMFTGQGAQYPNMGLGLYRTEAVFRETVDYSCERLKLPLGLDLREVLFPADDAREQAAERLERTALTQPALFMIEYALAKLWMSLGIQPAAMIGHSIGEYVAACLAGVMSLDDALDLVTERGRLMGEMPPGSMLAISLSEAQVLPLLSEQLSLASINSATLCVVSGPQIDIAALEARLLEMGLAPRRLHTSHAFHSSMMAPILEPFTRRVSQIALNPPQLPYISNVTGQWITAEQATDPAYYATHLREAVQFAKGLEQLFADPNCVFLEVGPGHTLTALAKRHPAHKEEHAFVASMRHPDETAVDEAVLVEGVGRLWLAGVRADWQALHGKHRRRRVTLPTYPFEQIRYWLEPDRAPGKRERLGRKTKSAEWTYVPSWKRAPSPTTGPSKRGANWLVFADEHGLASELETHMANDGSRVVSVAFGERFARKSPGKYVLNPTTREDYDRLLAELKTVSFTPEFIAHLWSVRRDEELRKEGDFISECQDRGFFSLILLAQALDACELNGPIGLAVLTSHVHEIDGSERICPENAMVLGPCKVIGMEYPHIRARSIDLAVDGDLRWLGQTVANDLCAPWTEPVVAYRGRYRWVQAFEQLQIHEHMPSPTPMRNSGVYLIAGGLGLIGLEIADLLARTARARLVLLSRTGLPKREYWARWLAEHDEEDTTNRIIRRLLAIESSGAEVLVCKGDVADEKRVREVIAKAETQFGPLCGVIHAAGAEARLLPIRSLRRADCEMQFRARLQGLRVLERVLRGKRLDFCLVNSSLASVMGVMDFASYTASQIFMDAFVYQHNKEKGGAPWRVINWDHWIQASGAESPSPAMPMYYMRPGEATDVLSQFLALTDVTQILVSTGDLQGRIDQWISREKTESGEMHRAENTATSHAHPRPALSTQYEAPRNDAERLLANIWGEMLGIDQLGIHDNFFDLGGDSLLAVSLFARIEREFGKKLPLATLFQYPTVEQLGSALNNGSHHFSTDWASLVPIQPNGSGPPLFLVHGAGGNVLLYRSLAEHLAPDYPLYGLQSRGLNGKSDPLATIEEMAIEYLREIRTIQRKGPYYLGGYCMGGTVAYEMAQILNHEGEAVALVAMMDTYNFSLTSTTSFASFLFQKLRFHLGNFARLHPREMVDYVIEKMRVARDGELANLMSSMRGSKKVEGVNSAVSGIEVSVQAVNDYAADHYLPKPYPGRLTLFKPQINYKFYSDRKMGWGDMAVRGLDIVELPMYPHAMLVEPFVSLLAKELRARMGAVAGANNLLHGVVATELAGSSFLPQTANF